jgi:hypothetical protein
LNAEHGDYTLQIRFLGDTLFSQTVSLNSNLDLKTIKTEPKTNLLQEVDIVERHKIIERKPDRLVFNTSNLPSTDGGNVIDILKVTPLLIVNDNSISIVGKGAVNVLLNDRFVQLSDEELINFLKGLPANDVKNIEVITTPPAKYSAEGNSGLINIVLKKAINNTWNASVFGRYTQSKYAIGSGGGNFNYRKNRFSFYTSASYSGGKSYTEDKSETYYPEIKWLSKSNYTYLSNNFNVHGGFDVDITERFLIGAMYIGSFGFAPKSIDYNKTSLSDILKDSVAGNIKTDGNGNSNSNTHSTNLHSIIILDSLGSKLNFDFDFISYNATSAKTFCSVTDNSILATVPNGFISQNNLLHRNINNYSAQIDAEHAIKMFQMNYGARFSFSQTDNDIKVSDLSSGTEMPDINQSNQFLYKENMQAVWISTSTQFGQRKWEAQVGLRGENTIFSGNSVTMDTLFDKHYFELFPTAYLGYNMNERNIFYLEYGRRISRPSFGQLNPFRSYSSPYYYFVGNPALKPAISNNVVLGYVFDNVFQVGAFFDYEKDNQGGGIVLLDSANYMQIGTRLNYLDSYDAGVAAVYVFQKFSWWTSQNSANVWYYQAKSKIYPLTPKTMQGVGLNLQTYNIFYLNKNQTIQTGFDFSYTPPQITELTYSYQRFMLNAFFKMLFFERKLSITLQGNNILMEKSFNTKSERNGMLLYSNGYYDPIHFRIAISYNFGNNNIRVEQRKNSNEEEKKRL